MQIDQMFKLLGLIASLIPFAAVLSMGWLSSSPEGQEDSHILSLFSFLFLLLGIVVHSVAPLFLFDVYFHKTENRKKRILLCIAPAMTILLWAFI
ncbi:MAG: hypothetical protein QF473_26410 [Planctomycetota bacterium]|jgi:hypothetical protein|nr:hypothetical protein [Planctomycetota bacterium]